jgi:hypothetical protein
MKFNAFIVIGLYLFTSCGSEEIKSTKTTTDKTIVTQTINDSIEVTEPTATVDTNQVEIISDVDFSYSYLMTEEVNLLKSYLLESNIQFLDYTLVNLSEARSDTSVISNFLNLISLTDLFKDSVINSKGYLDPMTAEEKFAILPDAIMGFKNSCIAECTEYDSSLDMEIFYALADKTTGSLDNDFFELIKIMDGQRYTSSHNFKNWFGQVWDYGGATLLGDSTHYNFLSKAQILQSKTTLGDTFIERYIGECAEDMLHGIYMYSPEAVLTEIEMILDLNIIDIVLEGKIKELKSQIFSKNYTCENCVGGKLQFSCESENCDFGG